MEKTCFIIMPISDSDNYPSGHFSRVYEHIIKPACDIAGFRTIRADDIMTTNLIALDIVKNIINCDMALCDLSSRNPNVLYELGIRQAFNLPVTLMKDFKTDRIFDIQGFRDLEYDESLRIDTVETTVNDLSELLKNTYENKSKEINSLIGLLGIEPAKISDRTKISADTELILNTLSNLEKRITRIEPKTAYENTKNEFTHIPSNVGDYLTPEEIKNLAIDDEIYHSKYGLGKITSIKKATNSNNHIGGIKYNNGARGSYLLEVSTNQFRKVIS